MCSLTTGGEVGLEGGEGVDEVVLGQSHYGTKPLFFISLLFYLIKVPFFMKNKEMRGPK